MRRLKRHILLLLLPLALLLSVGAQAAADPAYDTSAAAYAVHAEEAPLLPRALVYEGQFADVDPSSWYYAYAVSGYEYGLFNGRGDGFAPDADITVAELLTLSARLRAVYEESDIPAAAEDEAWYAPYVGYLDARELLPSGLDDPDAPATRAQLAGIFALSLPEDCYHDSNARLVTDAYASGQYIADVGEYTPYQPQILWMYRQGLLAGMDDSGSYWPDRTTTRAEVAAVVTRIVDPSARLALDWEVVAPYSAAGRTLASLTEAPDEVPEALNYYDDDVVDALVRQMLAAGENELTVNYRGSYTQSDVASLARRFVNRVKTYCEQMYNSVSVTANNRKGSATLIFSSTACDDTAERLVKEQYPALSTPDKSEKIRALSAEMLAQYREETMAKAIEIHDMLWETGQLSPEMSQTEIARVYYTWLCDNCEYDNSAVTDDSSLSHLAHSALLDGTAVCDGYTGAYNLFLKLEGIGCSALPNDTHIWTVATLDGTECHIDVTWGDQAGRVDMRYFAMTEEESYRAHPW
ncbi:MAG: S-layer homology domain-containing protein [Oscillospiraceae bacterium]|nr:S-layer homology domain-containing protein [Oscillospiraceae bacterium]